MTSGIYKLTFKSGDTYIGKSINIDNRWDQHADKMRKGTAAKAVQQAFNNYGMPEGIILADCHQDHLDLLEAAYIAGHNPTLNTSRPESPVAGYTEDTIQEIFKWCEKSTIQHIGIINDQSEFIDNLQKENIKLESEVIKLKKKRSDQELSTVQGQKINTLEHKLSLAESNLVNQDNRLKMLQDYKNSSWWHKLFN